MNLLKACSWFFKILSQGDKAFDNRPQPAPAAERPTFHRSSAPAVQLLGLLQKEGRLLDFLTEDITSYSDDEIGAAARDIHRGCQRVLDDNFTLRRVVTQSEGEQLEVDAGFDPSAIDIMGNLQAEAPYKGELIHAGWYAEEVKLPTVAEGADANVIAPAQVEVRA